MGLQGQQGIFHHRKVMEEVNDLKRPPQSQVRTAVALHSGHVLAKEVHFPTRDGQLSRDHVEQGGLPGAVRPYDHDSWASLIQSETHIFQYEQATKALV